MYITKIYIKNSDNTVILNGRNLKSIIGLFQPGITY